MATEITKEQSYILEPLSARCRKWAARAMSPSWLERLRENAFDTFRAAGFPAVKQEEWKYTNVAPIAKADFEPTFANPDETTSALESAQLRGFTYEEAERASWSSLTESIAGSFRP